MRDSRPKLGVTTTSTDLLLLYQDIKEGALTLRAKETYMDFTNTHRKFKADLEMDKEEVIEILEGLLRQDQKMDIERPREIRQKSREEEVNETRQRVLEAIRMNPHHTTKKAIAADAGCHPQTVTNILQWMAFSSLLSLSLYTNTTTVILSRPYID
jgi:hypothetical protein